jgi:hypothetical protein
VWLKEEAYFSEKLADVKLVFGETHQYHAFCDETQQTWDQNPIYKRWYVYIYIYKERFFNSE